jgi:hypothetical protein
MSGKTPNPCRPTNLAGFGACTSAPPIGAERPRDPAGEYRRGAPAGGRNWRSINVCRDIWAWFGSGPFADRVHLDARAKANTRANNFVSPCPGPCHLVNGLVGNLPGHLAICDILPSVGRVMGRSISYYGSEGWGFESLQARLQAR